MVTTNKTNNKIIIDPKIIPEEERKFLFDFIDFLEKRRSEKKILKKIAKPKIKFKEWALKVRGKLSRADIYEYL